ncbi:PREDICTED: F-box protein At3g59000-like [Brassica oleracea var. oleracea]|uniref:F-box protein At3g59000-like n=1 Tax=Brassica oleracea var. oleracea TaxID=109376 RepID=UPI0006A6BFF7|nr:PREDICTED: F-box protein At3g59000-like [Brassica oleracea var. oleracea]XP_013614703.1 PREDICTED: F-box protein At3g59000-like [Brassica oleracea var. oleracea]
MDRVSNLPDEVLCHILSFLTTKEAALTSILAKRWRNLLSFVPCITIDDDSVFLHLEEGKKDRQDIIQSFMNFVDRVLALQGNSPLKEFSLKCFTVVDTDRVDGWISNVLARGVSDLDLQIIIRSDKWIFYPMSPKCFECSTLVKLSIGCGVDVTLAAGRIFLPMLKTLVLVWVKVCPNEFETLLHALPSLEELVLVRVIWKDRDVIVSSASVKTLTVNLRFWLNTLSFDTPSLVHFEYSGSAAWDYPVVNMGNLVDTQIDFYLSQLYIKQLGAPYNDEVALGFSNVWKLFHGIRNAPHLSLFPDALEVLSMCSESLPVFNNLNSLAIRSDKDRGWQAMPALLRNCPHLENLVIKGPVHRVTDKCGDVCDCISREDKGLSLTLCPVKVIEIYGFQGTMKEMAMIKHFLDYFPSLKEMEVYAEENIYPTQLGGNQRVLEMFELYNKFSSCNVQLFI